VASILGSRSDRTDSWDNIIEYYKNGEKEAAYHGLGHMFHLLIDASIPDRTRDESNAFMYIEGISPYEDLLVNLTTSELDFSGQLLKEKAVPLSTNKIEKLFDDMVSYSSKNFFSEGTVFYIKDKNIVPSLTGKENNTGLIFSYVKNSKDTEQYHLVRYNLDLGSGYLRPTIVTPNIYGNKVAKDYWKQLSRQTILAGSGMINIFNSQLKGDNKSHLDLSLGSRQDSYFLGNIHNGFHFLGGFFSSGLNFLIGLFGSNNFATISLYQTDNDSVDSLPAKYFANLTTSDEYLKRIFDPNFPISLSGITESDQVIINRRVVNKEGQDQDELFRQSLSLEVLLPGSITKIVPVNQPLLLISGGGYGFGSGYGTGGGCSSNCGGGNPAATATLTAKPTSIISGASSILTWSSTNATACTGTGFSTSNAISGDQSVTPTTTTTFSITCTGAGASSGPVSATVTVTPVGGTTTTTTNTTGNGTVAGGTGTTTTTTNTTGNGTVAGGTGTTTTTTNTTGNGTVAGGTGTSTTTTTTTTNTTGNGTVAGGTGTTTSTSGTIRTGNGTTPGR